MDLDAVLAEVNALIQAEPDAAAYEIVLQQPVGVWVAAFLTLPVLADHSVEELQNSDGNVVLGVFVIRRSTAFAGAFVALFWGLLNLARAALDQGTPYQKRLMAAHFMHYIFDEYSERIGSTGFTLQERSSARSTRG